MGIHNLLPLLAKRLLDDLDNSAQVREFVVFFDRLTVEWVMPFIAEQFGQQRALVPAFARALDAAQHVDAMPKLAGFIFVKLAQFPFVSTGLLPSALDDALLGQVVQRVTAEDGGADPSIQAIQNVVPVTVGDKLGNGARAHATPVRIPAPVPAVDGDLALGGLIARIGFGRAITPAEVLEEHGYRVEPRSAGDHQLRHCRALNLQRFGRFVFCGHEASLPGIFQLQIEGE